MTFNELCKRVQKQEARTKLLLKQVKEVLGLVSEMVVLDEEVEKSLKDHGMRRILKRRVK